MLIAKVIGNIVSTQKHKDYVGQKLFIIQPIDLEGKPYGQQMVALDGADSHAGIGDKVLVIQEGGSARTAARVDHLGPIDLTVVGVIDSIITQQGNLFQDY
jgi:microcompartment protein CcmK/EutM